MDEPRARNTRGQQAPAREIDHLISSGVHDQGRAVPGDGAIHWDGLFTSLKAANYTGLFDLEIRGPRLHAEGDETAFRRAADWLVAKLRTHGIVGASS